VAGRIVVLLLLLLTPLTVLGQYYLRVDLYSVFVNKKSLSLDNPEIEVQPGARISGRIEVVVDNNRGGAWITPVVGVVSWSHVAVCITPDAPSGRSIQGFEFDISAPTEPGIYYIGVFSGWMYNCDEVLSNDHPAVYGDGDDVWDMPADGWEEVITKGVASRGPYHQPGRAIRVIVKQARGPDLTVLYPVYVIPRTVQAGDYITVTWIEENRGDMDSGQFRTSIYIGTSEYGLDYILWTSDYHSISAGHHMQFSQRLQVPTNTPAGDYYVTVFVDFAHEVPEADENNNIGSTTPNRISVRQGTIDLTSLLSSIAVVLSIIASILEMVRKLKSRSSGRAVVDGHSEATQ